MHLSQYFIAKFNTLFEKNNTSSNLKRKENDLIYR